MERQQDGLVPIGEAFDGLGGSVAAIRKASSKVRHHFTLTDQVHQWVGASKADPTKGEC